jgi:hypothetical protein
MTCPVYAASMSVVTLQDRSGVDFEVDVCNSRHAFWFDRYENTRLSPGSTVKLFNLIAKQPRTGAPPRQPIACPRYSQRLALTRDLQSRATKFEYWRCPTHGHFITVPAIPEQAGLRVVRWLGSKA